MLIAFLMIYLIFGMAISYEATNRAVQLRAEMGYYHEKYVIVGVFLLLTLVLPAYLAFVGIVSLFK